MNLDFPDYQQHVSVIDPGDSKLGLIKKLSTEDTVLYPNNPLVKLRHPITNGDRPKRNGETHLFINRAKIIMIIPALIKASVIETLSKLGIILVTTLSYHIFEACIVFAIPTIITQYVSIPIMFL